MTAVGRRSDVVLARVSEFGSVFTWQVVNGSAQDACAAAPFRFSSIMLECDVLASGRSALAFDVGRRLSCDVNRQVLRRGTG
jgi:hypothetical protein